jgi:hypothetical protein
LATLSSPMTSLLAAESRDSAICKQLRNDNLIGLLSNAERNATFAPPGR